MRPYARWFRQRTRLALLLCTCVYSLQALVPTPSSATQPMIVNAHVLSAEELTALERQVDTRLIPGAAIGSLSTVTVKPTPTVDRLQLQEVRNSSTSLELLLAQDRKARSMQVALMAVPPADKKARAAAFGAYARAEMDVEKERERAWAGFSGTSGATLIQQPLKLAMRALHTQVRRYVGPTLHTSVPGLKKDHGCTGDVIADELLDRYGQATASILPLRTADGSDARAKALLNLSVQISCLGARQLSQFGRGLEHGYAAVVRQMIRHRQGHLVDAFARIFAPVQVLLHDANKHMATRSPTYRWFVENGELLKGNTANAGWATGQLMLWDRRQGRLTGVPLCQAGQINGCVDLEAFIDSMYDPRALGLGDCALLGMVSKGRENVGGVPRYTCPVSSCESMTAAGGQISSLQVTGANALKPSQVTAVGGADPRLSEWMSMWGRSKADLQTLRGTCRSTGQDLQGINGDFDECLSMGFGKQQSPYDTYEACMVEALGGGELPQIGAELRGVPNGNKCRFSNEGDDTQEAEPSTSDEPTDTESESPEDSSGIAGVWDWATNIISAVSTYLGSLANDPVKGGIASAAGAIVDIETQLISEEGAGFVYGLGAWFSKMALDNALERNTITYEEYM